MRLRRFVCLSLMAATAVLAFGAAGAASSSTAAQQPSAATAPVKVGIKYTVKKFVRRGNRVYALGNATARYIPTSGSVTTSKAKPFRASVALRTRHTSSAQRICPVLDLTLGPLDLNLLGAMIHLDRVHLVITADSNGGVLGSLVCGLSGTRLQAITQQLNWVLQRSGLSSTGLSMVASVQPQTAADGSASSPNALTPLAICPVLDLALGPLHLDLLGLIIDLNRVHLTITADSEGGLLGSLLCGLAGGGA